MANVVVVGVVGCSASGKSTVVTALGERIASKDCLVRVVACDDFYRPFDQCPSFDLATEVPWPGGVVPDAFKARGNADLNVPAAVNWLKVLRKVHELQLEAEEAVAASAAATQSAKKGQQKEEEKSGAAELAAVRTRTVIIVEGLLLLGDDEGAALVRSEVDHFAVLSSSPDPGPQRELWTRKLHRAHLGKASYASQGVTEAQYQAYWEGYIEPRWREHGASRVGTAARGAVGSDVLDLSCHAPVEVNVARLVSTGWFTAARATEATEEKEEEEEEEMVVVEEAVAASRPCPPASAAVKTSWTGGGGGGVGKGGGGGGGERGGGLRRGRESGRDDRPAATATAAAAAGAAAAAAAAAPAASPGPGLPSGWSFGAAVCAAAVSSALDPLPRLGAFLALLLAYWFVRIRGK